MWHERTLIITDTLTLAIACKYPYLVDYLIQCIPTLPRSSQHIALERMWTKLVASCLVSYNLLIPYFIVHRSLGVYTYPILQLI